MSRISSSQLAQYRQDTPGVQSRIHFNNAGTSFPPQQALKPMLEYLEKESLTGGYELEAAFADKWAELYTLGAQFLNCSPEEVAYAGSNTLAWRTLFNGIRFSPGDEILTSVPEYGSNSLAYLQMKEEHGVVIRVVPNDEHGQLSLSALSDMINERTKLVSISHVPSSTGLVQKAAEIGAITRAAGVLYLLDACQSGGQLPLDVEKLGCDALTITGRKYMRGPRGSGLFYVRKAAQDQFIPPYLDLSSATQLTPTTYEIRQDARRFETYEQNRAVQLGLIEAIRYALEVGVDRIWERVHFLGNQLREGLSRIPGVQVLDRGETLGGIVSFVKEGRDSAELHQALHDRGVNLSLSPKGSAFDFFEALDITGAIRPSVHYYNSEEEIDRFVEWVKQV